MNIKIDLVISATPELLEAIQALTSHKVSGPAAPVISIADNGAEKKTRTKKTSGEIPNANDKELTAIETANASGGVKTDLTQEMIIADAVPKSKAGHKDKIKAKVTELGYESITDLQPVHFDEFFAFLQTIPKPA